jgi:hypothetical protein
VPQRKPPLNAIKARLHMVKNQGEAGLYRWHSLDHFVGAREQCRWNFEAKHPGDLRFTASSYLTGAGRKT